MSTTTNKVNYNELIPELREWNYGKGINVDTYISCVGNVNHLIGYISILYPQFYVYKDGIFLKQVIEDTFNYYLKLDNNLSDVEKVLNHRHIIDYFQHDTDFSLNQIKFIGEILKELWLFKLMNEFPNKHFIVEFHEGNKGNLTGYYLTFYQVK